VATSSLRHPAQDSHMGDKTSRTCPCLMGHRLLQGLGWGMVGLAPTQVLGQLRAKVGYTDSKSIP
jgi:hypothetical protein